MMKKTTLAAAVVLGLVSFNASASKLNGTGAGANTLAKETLISGNTQPVLTEAGGHAWDIVAESGYALSNNESRNVRIDCPNVTFNPAGISSITYAGGNVGAPTVVGGGTGLTFSISRTGNGTNTDLITVHPSTNPAATNGIKLKSLADTNCTYTLYDTPVNAIAGGATGVIYTSGSKPYLKYGTAMVFSSSTGTLITSFASDPAFSEFNNQIAPAQVNNSLNGTTGTVSFGVVPTAFDKDGNVATSASVYGTDTEVQLSGDVVAGGNVFFSVNSNCSTSDVPMDANKEFVFTSVPAASYNICYTVPGDEAIPDAVWSLTATTSNGTSSSAVAGGVIKKEGVELQATIANFHPNYVNRIVVANDSAAELPYSIRILSDAGNPVTTNSSMLTGTLPAKASKTIDLGEVLTGAAVAPRATVIMSVNTSNANSSAVKAMYQITHKANGAVSNAQMIRMSGNLDTGFGTYPVNVF